MKYRKSPDKDLVIIPGAGRVAPGQILEGPQYARFVKLGLLEEIEEAKPSGPSAAEKAAQAKAAKRAKALAQKAKAAAAEDAKNAAAFATKQYAEAAEAAASADVTAGAEGGSGDVPDDDEPCDVPISEEVAEDASEAVGGDLGETEASEDAKMMKRAATRRRKRTKS